MFYYLKQYIVYILYLGIDVHKQALCEFDEYDNDSDRDDSGQIYIFSEPDPAPARHSFCDLKHLEPVFNEAGLYGKDSWALWLNRHAYTRDKR